MRQTQISAMFIILLVLLAASAVLGCASPSPSATPTPAPTPTAAPTPGPVVLTVNGNVSTPLSMSMADLNALGATRINYTLNSHGTISYIDCDAVSLNALLSKAGVLSSASKIKFTGADAYNATIPLTNVTSDSKTVVAFTQTQGLRNCMPNEATKIWVQNLTTITLI